MTTPASADAPRRVTLFCPFGGGGGGGFGGQQARAELFGRKAVVELLGGIDNSEMACLDFEYLTGVPQTCADVARMTPADLRRILPHAPDIVLSSPPCKAASRLLPAKRTKEPKYEAMLDLALVMTRLLLETWETPPPILVWENVPSVTTRARAMVDEMQRTLRAAGYSVQNGFHDCGEVGALGQRRKRWFFVARHEKQVPFFLYKPPKRGVRSCWSVLGKLPLPGDPAGGPMHELPNISAVNHARLWAIPAGGDWRDLRDGSAPRRRSRRPSAARVRVAPPFEPTGMLVQLGPNGAGDPIIPPSKGFPGAWGVLHPGETSGAVTGNARISTGAFSVAEPRPPALVPQAKNAGMHHAKYQVLLPTEPAPPVTGATRVGSGAPSIAVDLSSLVPKRPAYDRAYGVLDPKEPSPTVAGTSSVGCGAYAIPSSVLPIKCAPRSGAYGVLDPNEHAKTIVASMNVDNSAAAIAAPALPPGYGVLSYEEAMKIATGEVQAPFMVVDRSDPTTPIAIVDRLDRAPYRLIATPPKSKRGKPRVKKVPAQLVMISEDGAWHRPLTTLELASLQGLPWQLRGAPLVFSGGSTDQREVVGNMIPPPAAQAIIEQMALCLLAADAGSFYLDSGGAGVWCRPEDRERLAREGVRIVHTTKPWRIGGARVCDDGAVVRSRPRAAKAAPKRAPRRSTSSAERLPC